MFHGPPCQLLQVPSPSPLEAQRPVPGCPAAPPRSPRGSAQQRPAAAAWSCPSTPRRSGFWFPAGVVCVLLPVGASKEGQFSRHPTPSPAKASHGMDRAGVFWFAACIPSGQKPVRQPRTASQTPHQTKRACLHRLLGHQERGHQIALGPGRVARQAPQLAAHQRLLLGEGLEQRWGGARAGVSGGFGV